MNRILSSKNFSELKECFCALSIRENERRSFLIGLAFVALAKLQASLQLTYSVDDYHQMLRGLPSIYFSLIGQGRFGAYWLAEAFAFIGYDPIRAPLLSTCAIVVLSVFIANGALRLLQTEIPDTLRVLFIVIIAAHPYTAEILSFRGIAIYHVIAYSAAIAAMLMARFSLIGIVFPALIFSACLTIYQVPVSYVSVLVCIDLSLRILKMIISEADRGEKKSVIDRAFLSRIVVLLVGVALYYLWLKLSTWGKPPHSRAVMIEIDQLPERILLGLKLIWQHLVTGGVYENPLVPVPVLAIPLILFAAAVVEMASRAKDLRYALVGVAVILITPVVAGFAMLGIPLFAQLLQLPPRVLSQIGLILVGIALMAFVVRRRFPQQIMTVLLGVVSFAFIAQNQQMFIDHARVGVRDHNFAVLLMSRLQEQPNFAHVKRITVVDYPENPLPVPTAIRPNAGFNGSLFYAKWSIAPMLSELFGIPLERGGPADKTAADEYCNGRQRWPSVEAVTVRVDLAIVCL